MTSCPSLVVWVTDSTIPQGFAVHIGQLDQEEMEFDMIGIDVSIVNAIRRILIAEVRRASRKWLQLNIHKLDSLHEVL